MMLAQLTGIQRLMIDGGEAKLLADAANDVAQYYDMPDIAPEALAWAGLIQALGIVYGTRIIAARREAKAQAAKPVNAQPQPANSKEQPPNPATAQRVNVGGVEYEMPPPGTH